MQVGLKSPGLPSKTLEDDIKQECSEELIKNQEEPEQSTDKTKSEGEENRNRLQKCDVINNRVEAKVNCAEQAEKN